jgi:hypothetical protein
MAGAAKLRIDADAADVQKAFGKIVSLTKKANDSMLATTRKTNVEVGKSLRQLQTQYATLALNIKRVGEEAAKRRLSVERTYTRAQKTEVDKRVSNEEQGAKKVESVATKTFRVHVRVEQMKTAKTLAEVYKRIQAEDRAYEQGNRRQRRAAGTGTGGGGNYRSRFGQFSFNAFGAARSFAQDMHGEIQGARARRAASGRNMNSAFYQAGAGSRDALPLREEAYQFARTNRMDSAELAEAMNAAQTEFSVLGNSHSTQGERQANMRGFLNNALLARDTGQDVGEVTRLAGMLQQAGITGFEPGGMGRNTLLGLTGMAQRGAVELGSVTRQALGPMQQRMATAVARLGPDASPQARAAAQQSAIFRSMADIEVGRGLGLNVRNLGNMDAVVERTLRSPNTQAKLLTNIRESTSLNSAQRTLAESTLFEGDAGHRTLRREFSQSPYDFARGLQTAFAGNSEAMVNTFAGSGRAGHNGQGLQTNWRNMFAMMMGGGAAGTDNDRIRELMRGVGSDFTETDVARGHELFSNDDQSQLTSNAENREAALRDQTNAMVRLSDQFARWSANNPFTASAFESFGNALGAGFLARIGNFRWGGGGGGGGIGESAAGTALGGLARGAAGSVASTLAAGALTVAGSLAIAGALTIAGAAFFTDHSAEGRGLEGLTGMNSAQRLWDGVTTMGTGAEREADRRRTAGQRSWDEAEAAHRQQQGEHFAASLETAAPSAGATESPMERTMRDGTVALSTASVREIVGGMVTAMRGAPLVFQLDTHEIDYAAAADNTQNRANGGG